MSFNFNFNLSMSLANSRLLICLPWMEPPLSSLCNEFMSQSRYVMNAVRDTHLFVVILLLLASSWFLFKTSLIFRFKLGDSMYLVTYT